MDTVPVIAADRRADEALKRRTMRRVYTVWFWRSVAPLLAVEFVMLAGVAAGVLAHVSVRHIAANAFSASADLPSFVRFFVDNFFVKSIQSRLLVAAYLLLAVFFVRVIRAALRRVGGGGLALIVAGNRTARPEVP